MWGLWLLCVVRNWETCGACWWRIASHKVGLWGHTLFWQWTSYCSIYVGVGCSQLLLLAWYVTLDWSSKTLNPEQSWFVDVWISFSWCWPGVGADDELQYDHLAAGLAEALKDDPTIFDAHRLKNFTGSVSVPLPFPCIVLVILLCPPGWLQSTSNCRFYAEGSAAVAATASIRRRASSSAPWGASRTMSRV